MAKLDINQLLTNSIARQQQGGYIQESQSGSQPSALALNLENVAFQDRVEQFIGEDVMNNIKGALGAGLATFAVLEARNQVR